MLRGNPCALPHPLQATSEHKKLIMRKFQSMVKVFERLTALGYNKHAVVDQLPFTALKQVWLVQAHPERALQRCSKQYVWLQWC